MVRAILEGRKTQTRRVVKQSQDNVGKDVAFAVCPAAESGWIGWFGLPNPNIAEFTKKAYTHGFPCPYGVPGDRLWVRESWLPFDEDHVMDGKRWAYMAETMPGSDGDRCRKDFGYKWRPSIHMPRAASRLTLEVVSVRVERVQEISEADAIAEGVCLPERAHTFAWADGPLRNEFAYLWESINGACEGCAWADNPWVWVVEFKRV